MDKPELRPLDISTVPRPEFNTIGDIVHELKTQNDLVIQQAAIIGRIQRCLYDIGAAVENLDKTADNMEKALNMLTFFVGAILFISIITGVLRWVF
jgi:hypothetical protein